MESLSLEDVRSAIEGEMHGLETEVEEVKTKLMIPTLGTSLHGFPRTLFGYMMVFFSYVDLLSRLWKGRGNQTQRMVDFLGQFFETNAVANRVCVQMWRHGLMHTANPQIVEDTSTGNRYEWLIHWGSQHLPPEQNLTLVERAGKEKDFILNVGLDGLISHLQHATWAFFNEIQESDALAETVVERWKAAQVERLRLEG